MLRQALHRRVLEEDRRSQIQPVHLVQPLRQLRQTDRVVAKAQQLLIGLNLRLLHLHLLRDRLYHRSAHPLTQQRHINLRSLSRRQRRSRARCPVRPQPLQLLPVPSGDQHLRAATAQRPIQPLQPRRAPQHLKPTAPQPLQRHLIDPHPPLRPQRPVNRDRPTPPIPIPSGDPLITQLRVPVQEPVRIRVVTLTHIPQRPAEGREQNQPLQSHPAGGLIQVHRPVHLRSQYPPKLLHTLLQDEVVLDHPRAVNDPVQPTLIAQNLLHTLRNRIPLRHIQHSVLHGCLRTVLLKLLKLLLSLRAQPRAARQHQV